jgi:hypothetical protein
MGIKCGTDMGIKCVILMSFSPLIYVSVLDLWVFFVMEYNVVVLIIHNISYTAISIKVVTETIKYEVYNMGAKRMVGIILFLNKSFRLLATLNDIVSFSI